MNGFITILSLILGILGLAATLVGTWLSYISFINPLIRFNKYLKNPSGWENFLGIESNISIYRYKKYPNFQIVIDWDNTVTENFKEEWVNDGLFPDKDNNASYYIRLEVNGMLLDRELFVSLDGHRYFVPVPRTKMEGQERGFFYDQKQSQLTRIIGKFHFDDMNLEVFAKKQKKSITIIEK